MITSLARATIARKALCAGACIRLTLYIVASAVFQTCNITSATQCCKLANSQTQRLFFSALSPPTSTAVAWITTRHHASELSSFPVP